MGHLRHVQVWCKGLALGQVRHRNETRPNTAIQAFILLFSRPLTRWSRLLRHWREWRIRQLLSAVPQLQGLWAVWNCGRYDTPTRQSLLSLCKETQPNICFWGKFRREDLDYTVLRGARYWYECLDWSWAHDWAPWKCIRVPLWNQHDDLCFWWLQFVEWNNGHYWVVRHQ